MNRGAVPIKTILIIVVMILVGALGVLGVSTVKSYMSGASADTEPKNVLAKPGEDGKSGVITWASDKPTAGVVEYGTTPASLLLRAIEADATASHKVTLSPLKPNVNYYFRIRVGEEVFDNNGIPYSFKTKESSSGNEVLISITPTLVPSNVPTLAGGCSRTVDYNKDGSVNSVDYIECVKKNLGSATPVPTVSGGCDPTKDYDSNGVVNSLDRIKCLQKAN
ncbi:MAG TPA: hypothetical protein PK370_02245 [Candidatus Woesebacteria bacterium]|nr:hypothetical protein [Candidatus Woesebacteria bacterium]